MARVYFVFQRRMIDKIAVAGSSVFLATSAVIIPRMRSMPAIGDQETLLPATKNAFEIALIDLFFACIAFVFDHKDPKVVIFD